MSTTLASHDRDIREPLFDFLEEKYGKIRILEEKKTGRARADVVMVLPQALAGIEIKSDNDTYERLKKQVRNYNAYYDYNIVVVGSTHAMHVAEHVSDWWGIISVEEIDGKPDFYVVREPQNNPKVKPRKEDFHPLAPGACTYPGRKPPAEIQGEKQGLRAGCAHHKSSAGDTVA